MDGPAAADGIQKFPRGETLNPRRYSKKLGNTVCVVVFDVYCLGFGVSSF